MKLLAHVHMMPPVHNAGAEHFLLALFREMERRGHETEVIAAHAHGDWTIDGVCCHGDPPGELAACLYEWADLVLTHLDMTKTAVDYATEYHRPLGHIVHNPDQLQANQVRLNEAQLIIANSEWLAERISTDVRTVVVRPPVDAARYRVTPGDSVTLMNMTEAKGARVFYDLARRLPDVPFLGVLGSYGHQLPPPPGLDNVTIWENQPDARTIYRRTRVLLMPSEVESWGRCAIEAAVSGIPTIAHPTIGLVEALGPAGVFADRQNLREWEMTLRALLDPAWPAASRRVQARAAQLDPKRDYDAFERACLQTIQSREFAYRPTYFVGPGKATWA